MPSAIIVEDEKNNQQYLAQLLRQHCPQVQVAAISANIREALQAIARHRPELVFLDVELPDGNAFDLLKKAQPIDFETIFITAYDHYAINAIRFCAIDYLLKPLKTEELRIAVRRAVQKIAKDEENQQLRYLLRNLKAGNQPKRLALPTTERIEFVKTTEVIRCQGENNYTRFYLNGKRSVLVSKTLREFEELLSGDGFMRVHQSHLVNLQFVQSFVRSDGGYLLLADGSKIAVSRKRREALLQLLGSK